MIPENMEREEKNVNIACNNEMVQSSPGNVRDIQSVSMS
jgi:hypothetical protein